MKELHGKQVASVWWPDSGNELGRNIEAGQHGRTIEVHVTYHGDHDEIWLVEKCQGITRYHNPRYVETFTLAMDTSQTPTEPSEGEKA